jgi:hypothetical protein
MMKVMPKKSEAVVNSVPAFLRHNNTKSWWPKVTQTLLTQY